MYGFLWNKIPGPFLVKLLVTLAVLAAVFWLLMTVVFPHLSTLMPYNDVSV